MPTPPLPEDRDPPVRVALLALPESSASVLYGLYDVLASVGQVWSGVTGMGEPYSGFDVQIVSPAGKPFTCHLGVPVTPHASLDQATSADIAIVTDLAIDTSADPRDRWPEASTWLRSQYENGVVVCTVCSGSVLLAGTGLLDGGAATTHWAYRDLFARFFPRVELQEERILVRAGEDERLITSGGSASWEDLSLYLIGRYRGVEAAIHTAKAYLFGDRSEGQLPYAAMTVTRRTDDAVISECQVWIADNYSGPNPVARMVQRSTLPERTFKRRFRAATGFTPIAYVQTLRIEEAKQLLESTLSATDAVGAQVGYEDPASFRRLFKRSTGVTPARYRQRFQPIGRLGANSMRKFVRE